MGGNLGVSVLRKRLPGWFDGLSFVSFHLIASMGICSDIMYSFRS